MSECDAGENISLDTCSEGESRGYPYVTDSCIQITHPTVTKDSTLGMVTARYLYPYSDSFTFCRLSESTVRQAPCIFILIQEH